MELTTLNFPVIAALAVTLLLPCAGLAMAQQEGGAADEIGIIGGSVSRAAFTEAVVNREPKSRITELPNSKQFIYYFSELKGMAGQYVSHRWIHDGKVMHEAKFNVGATRWRVWSSLPLQREWLGSWQVQVVNDLGQVVRSDSFNYVPAASR